MSPLDVIEGEVIKLDRGFPLVRLDDVASTRRRS